MLASWIYIYHKVRSERRQMMTEQIKRVMCFFTKKKKIGGGFILDLEEYERENK